MILTPRLVTAYAAGVNIGSYGLFWYDKHQAINRGWRVPEKTLQMSALAGGWIGGMLAMHHFRHKTRKEPFRSEYFSCIALNVVGAGAAAYAMVRGGGTANLATLQQAMRATPSARQFSPPPTRHKRRR